MDVLPQGPRPQACEGADPEVASILIDYPDLHDVPLAVLTNVGAYDTDCAGGCG